MTVKKRISVLDFKPNDCACIADTIEAHYREKGVSVKIAQFTKAQPFLFDFKEHRNGGMPYDMVFVGVDGMMGVEAARQIRDDDWDTPIFFVSESSDFALEAHRRSALYYILKPVTPERMAEALGRLGADGQISGRP